MSALTDPHCLSVPVSFSSFPSGSIDGQLPTSRGNAPGSKIFSPSPNGQLSFDSISPDSLFSALINSGSSNCFIDTNFINENHLQTHPITPLQLRLFDGTSNNMITQAIDLPIRFTTSVVTLMTFYVTPLDGSCTIILGHNWLAHNNPSIDRATSSISF